MRIALAGGIDIHAHGFDMGEQLVHFLLHALGTAAKEADILAAALRADLRRLLHVAAHVAAQLLRPVFALLAVERHADIALLALDHITAFAAGNKSVVAATVEEEHGLLAVFQTFGQFLNQQAAENGPVAAVQLLAHIHNGDFRHGTVLYAVGHFHQCVIAAPGHGEG